MNEEANQLKQFINSMGALCELWVIIYKSFITQGMNDDDALKHTKAFMSVTINTAMFKGKED